MATRGREVGKLRELAEATQRLITMGPVPLDLEADIARWGGDRPGRGA